MKTRITALLLTLTFLAGIGYVAWSRFSSFHNRNYLVGIVNPNKGSAEIVRGFMEGLSSFGFQEGDNVIYTKCEQEDQIEAALHDMVARKMSLIFTATTPATQKTMKAIAGGNIPAVFAIHDPVESGIIKSLSEPGGDLTGVQICGSVPKTLEWLLALVPGIKRVYVPICFDTKAASQSLASLRQAARSLGVTILEGEVRSEEELDAALASMPEDADAVILLHSMLISTHADKIAQAALLRKLPTAAAIEKCSEGVLVSYCPDLYRIGRQASRLAAQVLRGASPADVPSETAEFFLGINLNTADKLGLKIANDILLQADEIIR
ncbi:MAG: ABC transporter substrate-binding protein [Deltaproteobacteria bacterium]|nr:ABC transporter substrate-binding protein [Deltaproteobacteria bacterium]